MVIIPQHGCWRLQPWRKKRFWELTSRRYTRTRICFGELIHTCSSYRDYIENIHICIPYLWQFFAGETKLWLMNWAHLLQAPKIFTSPLSSRNPSSSSAWLACGNSISHTGGTRHTLPSECSSQASLHWYLGLYTGGLVPKCMIFSWSTRFYFIISPWDTHFYFGLGIH